MEKDLDTIVKHDFFSLFRVYESGRVKRLLGTSTVPAGTDPDTGVISKEVLINSGTGVSARLYLPPDLQLGAKLPVLVYIHGGGFIIETAASPTYHNYLNALVSKAHIIAISVEYRRAPEHPLPAAYDDCWDVIAWTAGSSCPDEWVSRYGDLERLYLGGDSAGGNTAHHMAEKAASQGTTGLAMKIKGILMCHPWFGGSKPTNSELANPMTTESLTNFWSYAHPGMNGMDDPFINPVDAKEGMDGIYKCEKVLVAVAQKDVLRDRGRFYYEKLLEAISSGKWNGRAEFYEAEEEDHVFYLQNSTCERAEQMMHRVVSFID